MAAASLFTQGPQRTFSSKKDDDPKDPESEDSGANEKGDRVQKASEAEVEGEGKEVKPKRKRRTKAEMEAARAAKSLEEKMKPVLAEEEAKLPIVHGPEVIVEVDEQIS